MIRLGFRIACAQDRRSVTAALGMALAAILFIAIILPGAAWIATGAHSSFERPASP